MYEKEYVNNAKNQYVSKNSLGLLQNARQGIAVEANEKPISHLGFGSDAATDAGFAGCAKISVVCKKTKKRPSTPRVCARDVGGARWSAMNSSNFSADVFFGLLFLFVVGEVGPPASADNGEAGFLGG